MSKFAVVDGAGERREVSTEHRRQTCRHERMVIHNDLRVVRCEDCKETLDTFEAFLKLNGRLAHMLRAETDYERLVRGIKWLTQQAFSDFRLSITKKSGARVSVVWQGKTLAATALSGWGGRAWFASSLNVAIDKLRHQFSLTDTSKEPL